MSCLSTILHRLHATTFWFIVYSMYIYVYIRHLSKISNQNNLFFYCLRPNYGIQAVINVIPPSNYHVWAQFCRVCMPNGVDKAATFCTYLCTSGIRGKKTHPAQWFLKAAISGDVCCHLLAHFWTKCAHMWVMGIYGKDFFSCSSIKCFISTEIGIENVHICVLEARKG